MNILELQQDLQNFTGKKISQTDLGIAMGNLKRQTVNTRIKNNSEVTVKELLNAQKKLEASIYIRTDNKDLAIITNTLDRQNDTSVPQKVEHFGRRMTELQDKHEYLDKDMAKLLRISEEEYIDLKLGDAEPDFNVLVRLKQCFKVSIDWLLFGD